MKGTREKPAKSIFVEIAFFTSSCSEFQFASSEAFKQAARTVGSEDSFENQLQERYYKKIYQKKKGKILPTVETQRIFGFLAPSRMYTQKSNYQHDYGQVGFDRLFNGNIP
uniref:Uncharacterized protein LOC114333394 n=1 Tax=Diabrotica virgifera virgifera TaxID=50390 RepID=A0A6P7G380_DIAVI